MSTCVSGPLAIALIVVYTISDLVFAVYQTVVPRPNVTGHDTFAQLVRFVYAHDKPYAGFPSEHSSSAAVFAVYVLIVARSRWGLAALLAAAVVVALTVLIKQHVVADAAGGVLLGLVVALLAFRTIRD